MNIGGRTLEALEAYEERQRLGFKEPKLRTFANRNEAALHTFDEESEEKKTVRRTCTPMEFLARLWPWEV